MYRNSKGEFMSKADKRLQRKIAIAQTKQVWRASVYVLMLALVPTMAILDRLDDEYIFENQAVSVEPVRDETKPFPPVTVEEIVNGLFEDEARLALAVAKAESQLNTRAIGWNCHYNGVSKACKVADREKAWSVDCGVFQINVIGKVCPERLFNPLENSKEARDIRLRGGWSRWVAFNLGLHEKYL